MVAVRLSMRQCQDAGQASHHVIVILPGKCHCVVAIIKTYSSLRLFYFFYEHILRLHAFLKYMYYSQICLPPIIVISTKCIS